MPALPAAPQPDERRTAGAPGRVRLPPRALILAPMVALSHRALRELILGFEKEPALDLAYTEMASAAGLVSNSPYNDCFLDAAPRPERVVYQFYTTKAERLPEALARVADRGVFGADINFGCSAPHILKAGGGAAWMREPEKAAELARAARGVWKASLSAKLRIGAEDDYGRLLDFCRGLVDAGLDFLTLHPRLEGQKFRRRGRWDYVARLVADLPLPVVGNGDVRSWADFRRWMGEADPAGIMIGREAARRPWIFSLLRGLDRDPGFELEVDLRGTALRFLELLEGLLPPEFHESRAKKFFFYYCDNFSFGHHLKWKIQNAPDLGSMRRALEDYFAELPGEARRIERG